MIIGIVVLLIIGFLILSWLGSQKEININLVDTDGTSVAGSLTLKDSTGRLVDTLPKGKSTKFKANLFPGDYTAKVTAEGYLPLDGETVTIESDDETGIVKLTLTKNLKATLTIALDTTKLYDGQTIVGKLNVLNSGNVFNTTDIIATTITPLQVTILPTGQSTLTSGGSANLDFEVKIKEGTTITKATASSITFKIKGSNVSSSKFDITAMPTINPTELTMTPSLTTTTNLTAGLQKETVLTFKNANKTIPLEDVKIEIHADAGFEDALDWITIANSETPLETTIPLIDPTKSQTIKIYIKAPIDAKKDEEFRGKIRVTTYSLKAPKEFLASYKVATETTVNLVFKMSPKIFNITCSKITGICTGAQKLSNGEARFENAGSVTIENILISLDLDAPEATANCQSYFRLWTPKIDKLEAGAKDGTTVVEVMDAPASGNTASEVCVLQWEYNNPLDPTTRERDRTIIEINKKTT